jgi:catechol 2,3-dioxygenase-like lactoylglutathione lyase family enzyme
MKIIGADHTSFTVANLARSLAFYVDLLGFSVIHIRPEITQTYFRRVVGLPDAVVKGAYLAIPGTEHRLELFEYVQPRGTPAHVEVNNPGSAHIAYLVDDLPALYSHLKANGAHFRTPPIALDEGPNAGGLAVYLLDPDGITIELFQPAPKPAVAPV